MVENNEFFEECPFCGTKLISVRKHVVHKHREEVKKLLITINKKLSDKEKCLIMAFMPSWLNSESTE